MSRRPTLKQINYDLDIVIASMERLRRDASEMLRRTEHAARDGFPSGSMGEGGGAADSSSTERAALAPPQADQVTRWVEQSFTALRKLAVGAQIVDGSRELVMSTAEPNRGRQSTVRLCANRNCGESVLGPLRRGRCEACYRYLQEHDRDRASDMIEAEQAKKERRVEDSRKVAS